MTNSLPHSGGIYRITCTANGKIYIGSAMDFNKRWRNHRVGLNNNNHSNRYMQSAWNKYGESAFIFEIVEFVMPWSILDREQYWLDKLKPYNRIIGFNVAKSATAPMLGRKGCKKSVPVSDETKAKLRAANIGKKQSPETIEKRMLKIRGKKMSPESIAKTTAANEKYWIVTSPAGEEILIRNLSKFCAENGLNRGNMITVAQGKRPYNHGWKCRYA